jgi:branched-chain amino acid transport system substrate-binding protein
MLSRLYIILMLVLASASTGLSPALAQTIKIGIINSYSGFLAQQGDQMEKGMSLYAKEHEKDLPAGVKIEIFRRDDGATPEVGKRVAQELILRERVNILMGVVSGPIAAAIAPLTAESKTPFVVTNAAGVTLPRLSPYIVRVSFTLWQQALPMGKWAAQQGRKRGYTAVTDFIAGHDAEGAFTKGFTDAGGEIVGAVRFPTTNPDFAPFVQRIKDARPDVAFLWIPAGPQATAMMKAVRDIKLREAGIDVVSTQDLVPDEQLPSMGDTPVGLITSGNYSTAGDRVANKTFLAAWTREYGAESIPDFFSVGGWDGMAAVFDVIKQTKGNFTADEAMKILTTWKTNDSPRGPIAIDPHTRDIVQNIYIRRTEIRDGRLVNVEIDTIAAVKDPWKELNPRK